MPEPLFDERPVGLFRANLNRWLLAGDGAWLDYVLRRNAFTIKPSDRSVLVDVTLVAVGGESGGVPGGVPRVPTREDRAALGEANDRSGDGGASWWTAALPGASEYCPGH